MKCELAGTTMKMAAKVPISSLKLHLRRKYCAKKTLKKMAFMFEGSDVEYLLDENGRMFRGGTMGPSKSMSLAKGAILIQPNLRSGSPALIGAAGDHAALRFLEFFTVNIR